MICDEIIEMINLLWCVLLIIFVIFFGNLGVILCNIVFILVFLVIIVCVYVLWFVLNIFLKLCENGLCFKLCNNVVYNVNGLFLLFYVLWLINDLLINCLIILYIFKECLKWLCFVVWKDRYSVFSCLIWCNFWNFLVLIKFYINWFLIWIYWCIGFLKIFFFINFKFIYVLVIIFFFFV